MRDRLSDFGLDTEVIVITFTEPDNVAAYRDANLLPFTILVDPDRAVYRAFGLGRGTVARVWGIRAARRYLELLRTSAIRRLRAPIEDTLQLGGDFVIAPDGSLAWGPWSQGPDDRPTIEELIDAVHTAREGHRTD